jgi:hypothetical protein
MTALLLEPPMADKSEPRTRTMRVMSDIISMLAVIDAAAELDGEKFNQVTFVDSLLRPGVTERYNQALDVLKKAKRK